MDRSEMLEMWNAMAREGNWVPSWTDSLAGLTPEDAAWSPGAGAHSIWQEVVHVTFWREVTIRRMAGGPAPASEEVERGEFLLPETLDVASWTLALEALHETHRALAIAIDDPDKDVSRIPYHLIHDAYHLGRITHLRAMRGVAPKF